MKMSECKKVLDYLDKNKLDELRKYILKEKQKEYLSNARKVLNQYIRTNHGILKEEDKFILSTYSSMFVFKSSEILTKNTKYKLCKTSTIKPEMIQRSYERFTKAEYKKASKTYRIDGISYCVVSEDKETKFRFLTKQIEYAKAFLGEDIEYNYSDQNLLLVKSSKGEGYIVGTRF